MLGKLAIYKVCLQLLSRTLLSRCLPVTLGNIKFDSYYLPGDLPFLFLEIELLFYLFFVAVLSMIIRFPEVDVGSVKTNP